MEIKSYSINYQKCLEQHPIIVLHGENTFLKNEIESQFIEILKKNNYDIKKYNENFLIENVEIFNSFILTENLFISKEILIITDATDKILDLIDVENVKKTNKQLILISELLSKNSKIKKIAITDNHFALITCYQDSKEQLKQLILNNINQKKYKISQETINKILNALSINRNDILDAFNKLELIAKNKEINEGIFLNIFNASNEQDHFDIVNLVMEGNKSELKKTLNIFYHYSFNFNQIIPILRYKIKKLIEILDSNQSNKDIKSLVENFKPPIFWKEKKTTEHQLSIWGKKDLHVLMNDTFEIEILCKKNHEISDIIFNKFLLDICDKKIKIFA